ncbi:hypothetical protein [Sphingosinicella terrae]|uniref:hypothetical protein n=1 Tax=Sphingosinicella terrae TaxID=2172047 RepID=UPI000E0D2D7B|nr:hypothetical protein [Sphingosinicella terrae]
MRKRIALAMTVLLALAGCDRLGFGQGTAPQNDAVENSAKANVAAAQNAAPADAGITRSRSLAGLTGTSTDAGGKDPGAIRASASGPIRADLLLGQWSDDGNCKQGVEFLADGTFTTSNGVAGEWSLDGSVLELAGPAETMRVELRAVTADRLVIANSDGTTAQSIRC